MSPRNWRTALARRADRLCRPFDGLVRATERLRAASRVLAEALPIGLLNSKQIDAVVATTYANAPDFYDPDRYAIRYEAELIPKLEALVPATQPTLLDLYCGHGREAALFARAGFTVLGVDRQATSIERARAYARAEGFDAEFLVADIDQWEPTGRSWDVVYTSLWMYSTVPDRSARLAWLQRLQEWVAPEGVLVISTYPPESERRATVRHQLARFLSTVTLNARVSERHDRFLDGLFWHDFTPVALAEELAAVGLHSVASLSFAGGTPCDFVVVRPGPPELVHG